MMMISNLADDRLTPPQTLTDGDTEMIQFALIAMKAQKEKAFADLEAMAKEPDNHTAQHLVRRLTPRDFGIPHLDRLIAIFGGEGAKTHDG